MKKIIFAAVALSLIFCANAQARRDEEETPKDHCTKEALKQKIPTSKWDDFMEQCQRTYKPKPKSKKEKFGL